MNNEDFDNFCTHIDCMYEVLESHKELSAVKEYFRKKKWSYMDFLEWKMKKN